MQNYSGVTDLARTVPEAPDFQVILPLRKLLALVERGPGPFILSIKNVGVEIILAGGVYG